MRVLSAVTIAAMLAVTSAAGAANLVQNGDFEDVTPPAGNPAGQGFRIPTGSIANWTFVQPSTPGYIYAYGYVVDPTSFPLFGSDGFGIYAGSLPNSSPTGGFFIGADGDPQFNTILQQTLTGLTTGTQYAVSFWQAAGQENNRSGDTTEWWQVSLDNEVQNSTVMNTPSESTSAWNYQTLTFTAQATSAVLSFMSMGTPLNLPPTVLLDGVTATAVPEPAAMGVLLAGIGGLFAARRRRKTAA